MKLGFGNQMNIKNGKHYCKIDLRESIEQDAIDKTKQIMSMFGSEYESILLHWQTTGKEVNY